MEDYTIDLPDVTEEEAEAVELIPAGFYFFKGMMPGDMAEFVTEFEDGKPVEDAPVKKGFSVFCVANERAVYDEAGILTGTEPCNVAKSNDFKVFNTDGTINEWHFKKLRSWWMVNHGADLPKTQKGDKTVLDWEAITAGLHLGDGAWGTIQHFKDDDGGKHPFIGGKFSSKPWQKAPKEIKKED